MPSGWLNTSNPVEIQTTWWKNISALDSKEMSPFLRMVAKTICLPKQYIDWMFNQNKHCIIDDSFPTYGGHKHMLT